MKICGQCGFENEDDVKFCAQCGAESEEVTETDYAEELHEVSEAEALVSEAIEEAVDVTGTEEIPEVVDAVEKVVYEEATDVADDESPETEEAVSEEVTDAAAAFVDGMDGQEGVTPLAERKPVPKGVKIGVLAAVVVIAIAVLFYFFGSLGMLAKVGIINTGRYMGIVQDKMIQETEESPAVRLEDAFDAFFEKEPEAQTEAEAEETGIMNLFNKLIGNSADESAVSWTAQKTADGVVVKAETVCTFDRKENTVSTYSVKLNFDGSIGSEEFSASDKVLDSEQTLSVLQKIARYSDPEKKDYTTKELSSSKYNNRSFYYPSGLTLEMLAGDRASEFLTQYGMPEDVEGTTDMTVLEKLIKGEIYAQMYGISFDEIKAQLGLDDTVTPDMTWGEIEGEVLLRNYGVTEENFEEFKKNNGWNDDVTLDSKFKDVEPQMIKFQLEETKRMQAEQEAAAGNAEAEAAPAEEAVVETEAAPAEEAVAETEAVSAETPEQ